MENMVNDHMPSINPGVRFTAADLKTVYAVCIDRFEDLDMELRSRPTEQRRKDAAAEKACVEAVLRQICNAGVTPVDCVRTGTALSIVSLYKGDIPATCTARCRGIAQK
jgi:hypothetical protein